MRGTILTWDGAKGTVSCEGQQYTFTIALWKGNAAPAPDTTVTVSLADGAVTSIEPLSDADLSKEKLALASDRGKKIASGILDSAGREVAIAYALFAVTALFLPFVNFAGSPMTITLPVILNGLNDVPSNGGFGLILVIIAIASIAVPYFWKNRFAPLAYCVPLLVTLYGDLGAYNALNEYKAQLGGADSIASQMGMTSPLSLGIGAFATFVVAAYLAWRAYQAYQRKPA
jgi:hypothetical protein